jgi:hypothetical protein
MKDGLKSLPTVVDKSYRKGVRATIVRDLAQGQGYFAEALSQYLVNSEVGCAFPCAAAIVRWCTLYGYPRDICIQCTTARWQRHRGMHIPPRS